MVVSIALVMGAVESDDGDTGDSYRRVCDEVFCSLQ